MFLCFPDGDQDNGTKKAETTREQTRFEELEGM